MAQLKKSAGGNVFFGNKFYLSLVACINIPVFDLVNRYICCRIKAIGDGEHCVVNAAAVYRNAVVGANRADVGKKACKNYSEVTLCQFDACFSTAVVNIRRLLSVNRVYCNPRWSKKS